MKALIRDLVQENASSEMGALTLPQMKESLRAATNLMEEWRSITDVQLKAPHVLHGLTQRSMEQRNSKPS
jgi:hypothetical protein